MQEEDLVWFAEKWHVSSRGGGDGEDAFHDLVIKRAQTEVDTRVLPPLRSPSMLVMPVSTAESEKPWYFGDKYFLKRPLEWSGDDDELVGWKLVSQVDAKGKDVSEGDVILDKDVSVEKGATASEAATKEEGGD